MWAGDQRQKLFRNLEVLDGEILLSAVTAPGAGVLPWDERVCAVLGEHVHSGQLGCRVREREAGEWNRSAADRWRRLHRRAYQETVRRFGRGSVWLVARVWEVQARGVLHVHPVLAHGTACQTRSFELPKNGRTRVVVLTTPAKAGLLAMPRPVSSDAMVFCGRRGGVLTGRTQHYYWHPVRCRFGKPSMDFYELRHFCGSWLFNDLELPAQDVAHQLGHTDGGALVQRLYGHPFERLARERIKRAISNDGPTKLSVLRSQDEVR